MTTLAAVVTFVVLTGLLLALVGVTFGKFKIQATDTYSAHFADSSGLTTSSDVRGAGVSIGSVKSIKLDPKGGVLVAFSVPSDVKLTDATNARIRYANLTGDRYIDLTPGTASATTTQLRPGGTIAERNTQPALDLDDFLRGFNPLMQALSPDQINTLASNILGVTQGQQAAIGSMLTNVAAFTNGLADRDKLIGEVITNLSATLGTFDKHKADFNQMLDQLARLTKGLAADRQQLGASIHGVAQVAQDVDGLLAAVRPGLKQNLDALGVTAANLNSQSTYLNYALGIMKTQFNKEGRLGIYGSFFNLYLCNIQVEVISPGSSTGIFTPRVSSDAARCNAPKVNAPGGDL